MGRLSHSPAQTNFEQERRRRRREKLRREEAAPRSVKSCPIPTSSRSGQ